MYDTGGAPYMYNYRNAVISQVEPSTVHARDTFITWYWRRWLLQKAIALFEWTLPTHWDRDYFLYCLYCYGFVAVVKTDKYGVIPQACTLGGLNVFYRPTFALISNPLLSGVLSPIIGQQCTLFKLRPDYGGIMDVTNQYAELLAMATETMATNMFNSQLSYIFTATGKAAAESFKKLYDEIHSGNPAAVVDKALLDKDGKPTWQAFEQNLKQVFICPELQELKLMGDIAFDMQRCWKGVFNPKLNLSAGPMAQLRAGIVYDEVNSNNVETAIDWQQTLQALQAVCKETVEMFKLDPGILSVKWREVESPAMPEEGGGEYAE